MESLLSSLNPAQKEAATTINKHVRIVAGAGSGKTRVLIARIEYLLNEIGVFPNRVLAITFTNKAANEMKERLAAQVGEDAARQVRISTIHGLCVRILKEDARTIGYPSNFTILDPEDQKRILKDIYGAMEINKTDLPMSRALSRISGYKTAGVSPVSASQMAYSDEESVISEVYERYEKAKDEMRAMDFDDLLLNADRLLKNNQEVRTKWQNRLDYLHVDEFQDVDPNQYSIIRSLTRPDAVLCVVGDPDQTIYTWRGASVDLILHFDRDFKPSHTVILSENYRSTAPILGASNAVVANNRSRIKKDLYTNLPGDDLLVLHESDTEEEETIFVARQISALHKKGMPYKDMAILYRANYCSRPFEKKLHSLRIPYQIFGGIRFFERMEVKDILSYLKLLSHPDPEDEKALAMNLAFSRVINTPRRGIGAKTVDKVAAYAREHGINMLEAGREGAGLAAGSMKKVQGFIETIEDLKKERERLSLPDLVDVILDYTGYGSMLRENKEEERLENIQELKVDMQEALEENPDLTLEQYLQDIALFTDRQATEEEEGGLKLMTVHASKGTEYPVVFIVSFNEEVFPSGRSIEEGLSSAMEEERRLLYVAMTRAKNRLFITWNRDFSYYTNRSRTPSRFIQEIPEEYVEKEEEERYAPASRKAESKYSVQQRNRLSGRKTARKIHYRKGDLVDHAIYGEGVIVSLKGDLASIAFPHPIGVKQMNLNHPSITPKKAK